MACHGVQTPSAKDIQSKLGKPLGTLGLAKELANKPKELANSAKVNTPNADSLASKVQPFTNSPLLPLSSYCSCWTTTNRLSILCVAQQ